MTPPIPRFTSHRTAVVLVAALVSIGLPSFAIEPARLSGGITGMVSDGLGIPQMGATVLLFNRQDRLFARALSDEKAVFLSSALCRMYIPSA